MSANHQLQRTRYRGRCPLSRTAEQTRWRVVGVGVRAVAQGLALGPVANQLVRLR